MCVLVCVLVCVSCGSGGPSRAEERTGTCEQFDRDPEWQQTLAVVIDPNDELGPIPHDGEDALRVVRIYCPEHLGAARQAVRDLAA